LAIRASYSRVPARSKASRAELVHEHRAHAGLLRLGQRAHRIGIPGVFGADPREIALVAALGLGELHVLQHLLAGVRRGLHAAMVHPHFGSAVHGRFL
jgi:hypothetical protein